MSFPDSERCTATFSFHRDKVARCERRAKADGFCAQHNPVEVARRGEARIAGGGKPSEADHWTAWKIREAAFDELLTALKNLRDAATEAYKAGRIPAEPFVAAGNAIAKAEGR